MGPSSDTQVEHGVVDRRDRVLCLRKSRASFEWAFRKRGQSGSDVVAPSERQISVHPNLASLSSKTEYFTVVEALTSESCSERRCW